MCNLEHRYLASAILESTRTHVLWIRRRMMQRDVCPQGLKPTSELEQRLRGEVRMYLARDGKVRSIRSFGISLQIARWTLMLITMCRKGLLQFHVLRVAHDIQ